MSLYEDMNAKRPGEWTTDDIQALQRKHGRIHFDHFRGVDTSHFKVWVLKRGRLARVTKRQARSKGYQVVSEGKKRPDISQVRNAKGGAGRGGKE